MSAWGRLLRRFAAVPELPAGFTGTLDPGERIVTMGELAGGGHLVLTQLGLWVPEGADIDELKVKTIYVEQGATLKRFTARAKGRGNRISKPTCHVYVTVGN